MNMKFNIRVEQYKNNSSLEQTKFHFWYVCILVSWGFPLIFTSSHRRRFVVSNIYNIHNVGKFNIKNSCSSRILSRLLQKTQLKATQKCLIDEGEKAFQDSTEFTVSS